MLDHPIVDVALGLILLYSTLSLVASVVKEWISSIFAWRAKNLEKGVQNLIGEAHAARLYGHPLVSTLSKEKKLPSYIGSGTFASVLVDLVGQDENGRSVVATGDKAAKLVDRVGDDPILGPAFRALSNAGAETVADLRREIADWFDEGMNRVSGWYRRRAQLIVFAIGLVVAVSANASTIHVVRDLWEDDARRYTLAQQAVAVAADAEGSETLPVPDDLLASFPLGWGGCLGLEGLGMDHASDRMGVYCRGCIARSPVLVRSAEPGGNVAGNREQARMPSSYRSRNSQVQVLRALDPRKGAPIAERSQFFCRAMHSRPLGLGPRAAAWHAAAATVARR